MSVVAAGGAAAQMSIFSSALESSLSGQTGDALPILVLADVGSWAGAPDGKLDLITADTSSRTRPNGQTLVGFATVWYGNGDGTFTNSNFGTPLNRIPTALAVGDFDGDQLPDLAVTDTSGNLVLLHGNGDGTFNQPGPAVLAGGRCSVSVTTACTAIGDCPLGQTCTATPVALTAAEANHDGHLDLIIVNNTQSAGWVTVLFGDGQGGFTPGNPVDLGAGGSAIDFFTVGGNVNVAVANKNTNSVIILRGDSNGSLSISQTISEDPNGREPIAIAAGDLNKDGHPDLVAVNHISDNIGVFLGQLDGSLQLKRFVDSGTMNSAPNGVALFDANGDGKLDVAVSNGLSSDVSVVLGDGTGNFGAPRAFVADQEPLAVAAGDLDGDGIQDLVALNRDNTTPDAVVLLGQGDGTFEGVEDVIVEPTPNAVIAGDIDNDGLADLIVSRSLSVCSNETTKSCSTNSDCGGGNTCQPVGRLLLRRSLPNGGFAAPPALQFPGDAFAMGRGDFNADGRLDIVVLNKSTSNVSMFLGQRDGFPSTPQNYPVGAGGVALAVGDWDGNGRPDLAVARQADNGSGAIDILLSNADGSLQSAVSLPPLGSNPVAINWGDFNKDGDLDLAAVVSQLGTCSLTTSRTCNVDAECPKGEGCVRQTSKLTVLLGNGNGTFQSGIDTAIVGATVDASALAVADFDGDGFDDVAVLLPSHNNQVVLLYGNGQGSFTSGGTLPLSSAPWSLAAGDISGDLMPDLVVPVHAETHAVLSYFNQGSRGQFAPQTSVPVSRSQGSTSIIVADFDGDGRYDVATANDWTAGSVSVLTNITATPIIRGDGNGDGKVTAADLVAVARKLRDGAATRVEQVGKGSYLAAPGADANGDGLVTAQDAWALAHRLFPRI
jgi:hypothetical protein